MRISKTLIAMLANAEGPMPIALRAQRRRLCSPIRPGKSPSRGKPTQHRIAHQLRVRTALQVMCSKALAFRSRQIATLHKSLVLAASALALVAPSLSEAKAKPGPRSHAAKAAKKPARCCKIANCHSAGAGGYSEPCRVGT